MSTAKASATGAPAPRKAAPAAPARDLTHTPFLERLFERGCQGRAPPPRTRVRQAGHMRLREGGPWLPFTATQDFYARGPRFSWRARVAMGRVLHVPVSVVDAYAGESGRCSVKLFGVLPLASDKGELVNEAQVQRWLGEIMWNPAALKLCPELRITGKGRGRAELECRGARVTMFTNADVNCVDVRAVRYRGDTGQKQEWGAQASDFRLMGDIYVPTSAEAWWITPGTTDRFVYFKAKITDVEIP